MIKIKTLKKVLDELESQGMDCVTIQSESIPFKNAFGPLHKIFFKSAYADFFIMPEINDGNGNILHSEFVSISQSWPNNRAGDDKL